MFAFFLLKEFEIFFSQVQYIGKSGPGSSKVHLKIKFSDVYNSYMSKIRKLSDLWYVTILTRLMIYKSL